MQTGMTCPTCNMPILTNQVIVELPVVRIVNVGKSALTWEEIVFHVECFTEKMAGKPLVLPFTGTNGKH